MTCIKRRDERIRDAPALRRKGLSVEPMSGSIAMRGGTSADQNGFEPREGDSTMSLGGAMKFRSSKRFVRRALLADALAYVLAGTGGAFAQRVRVGWLASLPGRR